MKREETTVLDSFTVDVYFWTYTKIDSQTFLSNRSLSKFILCHGDSTLCRGLIKVDLTKRDRSTTFGNSDKGFFSITKISTKFPHTNCYRLLDSKPRLPVFREKAQCNLGNFIKLIWDTRRRKSRLFHSGIYEGCL